MYLLHTTDFRLKLYLDDAKRPPYAILSHTWLRDGDEVSFEGLAQYHSAKADEKAQEADTIWSLPGFCKIRGSCEIAKQHGMEWIWIDTCCIDKRSSAELSEAINSMFKWYKESAMCIVFLEDVRGTVISEDLLRDSRWFTRGWTLQELLAPQKQLLFFDCEWQLIADLRKNNELCRVISHMTRIPAAYLNGAPLSEVCVAKKMSWAANRETTRIEDRAYSLLGIFDVNMALLYGEGEKAFIRLQEEILNQTHDHSILAWGRMIDWRKDHHDVRDPTRVGVFAASPQEFEDCWDFEIAPEENWQTSNSAVYFTTFVIVLALDPVAAVPNLLPFARD
ncbi:heterokaryon incompatibility protein-domain-containing protein [Astrocystis sublimbata]|nr:heterokaryon incompatibility protein-domain-containing protein [Astrocystis sublimbata]